SKRSDNRNRRNQRRRNRRVNRSAVPQNRSRRPAPRPQGQRPRPTAAGGSPTLRVVPLGGVGTMGKNMVAIEYGNDIVVVDCGLMMPDESMLGIDYVIPEITYLEQNRKKVRAFVITHGHEDHIGAVPYVVPKLGVPVFAPKLAAALIRVNLEEYSNIGNVQIIDYQANDKFRLGVFTVSFFRVNHSIPDAFGIIIETPVGTILYTGDFKFDPTPPDGILADYDKLKKVGSQHPLLLMSESTNAHTPGRTPSEQVIADAFMEIFATTPGRLIVSSFASRIDRMQHVIAAAIKHKRKVAIAGRSMIKYFDVASKLGYLKHPRDLMVPLRNLKQYRDNQLVILSTGSQGQEGSALQRMAFGEHKQVKIKTGDTVVLSSSAIPGNERSVTAVINNLYREGANVIFDKKMQVHVTGHAYQEEMKMMLDMVKPKYFIPVHGEYHMMVAHKELAEGMGFNPKNIFLIEDGDVMEFDRAGQARKSNRRVQVGSVLVDGLGVGDVKEVVLRDRKTMAAEGMIMLIAVVDKKGKLIGSPDIVSRGFVYMREKGDLINKVRQQIKQLFAKHVSAVPDDWTNIKTKLRETVSDYLYRETERRPLVLPVIIEV
ncbi:MAG: ribonuclease J, partial [bacterium]